MSNIQKNNDIVGAAAPLTLAEKMALKKKANKLTGSNVALILDRSISMTTDIEPGKSRWDALQEIVKGIPGDPLTIAFGDIPEVVPKDKLGFPHGCTYIAKALQTAKQNGCYKAILISDGEPSDPNDAIDEARDMTLSVMFVGGANKPQFLEDIANAAGGTCSVEDLTKAKELESKLTLLLEAGKSDDPKKGGTICL